MGSSLSVMTIVTPILALLAGIIAVVVEQIDEKLDSLRRRIGRNPVSPKVYGWTIADLEKTKKNWIALDPKGYEFPVNEPYPMTMPEQVRFDHIYFQLKCFFFFFSNRLIEFFKVVDRIFIRAKTACRKAGDHGTEAEIERLEKQIGVLN